MCNVNKPQRIITYLCTSPQPFKVLSHFSVYCFGFMVQLHCFDSFSPLSCRETSNEPSTKQQEFNDKPVSIEQHLIAKNTDISVQDLVKTKGAIVSEHVRQISSSGSLKLQFSWQQWFSHICWNCGWVGGWGCPYSRMTTSWKQGASTVTREVWWFLADFIFAGNPLKLFTAYCNTGVMAVSQNPFFFPFWEWDCHKPDMETET